MKNMRWLMAGICVLLSACLPAFLQEPAGSPSTTQAAVLQPTAAIFVKQTLLALSTPLIIPSDTRVVATASSTPIPGTATETQNPILLTLTATLGTGTTSALPQTPGILASPTGTGTGTFVTTTPVATTTAAHSTTPTETLHPRHYGTMPPFLPFGGITLVNKSRAEAYISLQCTTPDGEVTIIETPVEGTVQVKAPAGRYIYVAWVGGKKMTGNFGLGNKEDLTLRIYKNRIETHAE
jgi:hypothetical protein